jgi:hypothetical protein
MAYASGDHRQALFATGVVLFVMIMLLNIMANMLTGKVQLWRTRTAGRPSLRSLTRGPVAADQGEHV